MNKEQIMAHLEEARKWMDLHLSDSDFKVTDKQIELCQIEIDNLRHKLINYKTSERWV